MDNQTRRQIASSLRAAAAKLTASDDFHSAIDVEQWYHGTSYKSLRSIMKEGLKNPNLTDSYKVATYYAETASDEDGSDPVVIEVHSVDNSLLRVDYPAYEEPLSFYYKSYAKSEQEWHKKIELGEIPYPSSDTDLQPAVEATRSLRYIGTIKPELLKVVEE